MEKEVWRQAGQCRDDKSLQVRDPFQWSFHKADSRPRPPAMLLVGLWERHTCAPREAEPVCMSGCPHARVLGQRPWAGVWEPAGGVDGGAPVRERAHLSGWVGVRWGVPTSPAALRSL